MDFIGKLHFDGPTGFDACKILRFGPRRNTNARDKWDHESKMIESILSLRLPNTSTFSGLFDVLRVIRVDTPNDEVEKALVSESKNIEIIHFRNLYISTNQQSGI